MRTKTLGLCISLIVAHLFTGSSAFAQSPADQTVPEYLDFSQFETIVPADRLGFFDSLKWAGMKFVNAPAANRIVALYEYDARGAIEGTSCSDKRFQSHHALIVDRKVSAREMIEIVEETTLSDGACQQVDIVAELNRNQWVSKKTLTAILDECPQLSNSVPEAAPVWYELSFSNSCELRDILSDLDYDTVVWSPANDPKLRSIVESRATSTDSNNASGPRVIVTDRFFAASSQKRYFAECRFLADPQTDNLSLCGTVVQ